MKKILLAVLAMLMVVNGSIGMAQEISVRAEGITPERVMRNVISTQGKIEEIREGMVKVSGQGTYDEIILHVQEDTYIVSAQDGSPALLEDLKKGDVITAYYGPALTRSLPPQGKAIALVVGIPEQGSAGMYMKVGALQENNDGSIRVLCTNNERMVTIHPEILGEFSEIQEGSELMVWYEIMTMSIPGQATATKAVLLPIKGQKVSSEESFSL